MEVAAAAREVEVADELRKIEEVELRGTALTIRAPARRLRVVVLQMR